MWSRGGRLAEGRVVLQPPETLSDLYKGRPTRSHVLGVDFIEQTLCLSVLKCSSSAFRPHFKLIRRFFMVQSVTEISLPLTEAELMRRRRVRVSFALPH